MAAPIWVISMGGFGEAVARYLRGLHPGVVAIDRHALFKRDPAGEPFLCLAASRPADRLCYELDAASSRLGCTFVPLIMEGCTMNVGPVSSAREGGCWECWMKRREQHEEFASARAKLAAHYQGSESSGPVGHLDSTALIGASRLLSVAEQWERGAVVAGKLWQMNILTRDVRTGRVIPVHGCPKCGCDAPVEQRSYRELAKCMSRLSPGGAW